MVAVVIFFKYWDKSSQVNGIFLNLSGEGKLAETKRREQFTLHSSTFKRSTSQNNF